MKEQIITSKTNDTEKIPETTTIKMTFCQLPYRKSFVIQLDKKQQSIDF